jgi:hypothetical protein
MLRTLGFLAFCALIVPAQVKRPPGSFENDRVMVESKIYMDRESVRQLIGHDFDGSVAVVELTVTPRGGEALDVEREDWILFSNKDAQKGPAFHPSQLAGQGAIVIKQQPGGGVAAGNAGGPTLGIPGMGGRGRLGNGGGIGNTASANTETTVETKNDETVNPILATLKKKELVYGKTMKPVKGLLYFSLEGKHKFKDMEMWYRGPAGKFVISYKP